MPARYAELHALSNFTFLRGASQPEELVATAATLGYEALAITDECSMSGVVRAHMAAKDCGLKKLVIGSEFCLPSGRRLVVLAENRDGYAALCALITKARRAAGKGEYRLRRDDFDKDAFNQWFDRYKPDAIIGLLHTMHGWLEEGGVRVPQDVAFACLNVFSYMPFSGISVQLDEVGRTAMDFMISQLSENMWGVPTDQKIVMLEPHWVDGATMPPAKGVSAGSVRAPRKSRAKSSSKAR
jgi:hypothetical protein